MNIKNKFLLSICIVFLISILNGCGVSNDNKDIYNNNEKIAEKAESHTYITYNSAKNSDDNIDLKYGGFSGVDTIWILKSKDDGEITLEYDSKVNSGDFKAVLVNSEKEIQNILEGSDQGNKTIKLTKGEYRFKFVGSNAKGEAKFSITENKNVEITSADRK